MTVIFKYPPNYAEICKALPGVKLNQGVVFTYGEDVYVPNGKPLVDHVSVHEAIHIVQQRQRGRDSWWEWYLMDPKFRLREEVEAYRNQWEFLKNNYSRSDRRKILKKLAHSLCGPIYGNAVNYDEAKELIQGVTQL